MKALFKKRCGRLAFESAFKSAGIGSDYNPKPGSIILTCPLSEKSAELKLAEVVVVVGLQKPLNSESASLFKHPHSLTFSLFRSQPSFSFSSSNQVSSSNSSLFVYYLRFCDSFNLRVALIIEPRF